MKKSICAQQSFRGSTRSTRTHSEGEVGADADPHSAARLPGTWCQVSEFYGLSMKAPITPPVSSDLIPEQRATHGGSEGTDKCITK